MSKIDSKEEEEKEEGERRTADRVGGREDKINRKRGEWKGGNVEMN